MKLYDGRDKRFKNLIDTKEIMKENNLRLTEVLPKHARAKWYTILLLYTFGTVLCMGAIWLLVDIGIFVIRGERLRFNGVVRVLPYLFLYGFLAGCYSVLTSRRWTWKSDVVAIRTLAERGFCPNCGYIIRDTPAESDGCTPCGECGHAWRVGT